MVLSVLAPVVTGEPLRCYLDRSRLLSQATHRSITQEALGRRFSRVDWALPCGVAAFASRLGKFLGAPEPLYWLESHTLAPFWSSVLDGNRRSEYEARLLADAPGPRKPLLPIAASEWFSCVPVLCPVCDDLSLGTHGFSHVQRKWLLPFASRCEVHGEVLQRYPQWAPHDRGPGIPAQVVPRRGAAGINLLERVAALLEPSNLQDEIGSLVRSRGYTTRNGRLRRGALCELLLRYSRGRHEHPELDRLLSSADKVNRLLRPLWSPRCCLHPVIGLELVAALTSEPEVAPQLPLAPAPRQSARAALSAGMANFSTATDLARRAGVSVTTATLAARTSGLNVVLRPKVLKDDVRRRVEEQLAAGVPVYQAAHLSGVSLSTAYRVLAVNKKLGQDRQEQKVRKARQKWTKLLTRHPQLTRTQARRRARSVYAFLYRCDREWLMQTAAAAAPDRKPWSTSRTPAELDIQCSGRVLQAARDAAADGDAAHGTVTSLLKAAGRGGRKLRHASTPLTLQVLSDLSEPLSAFVYRRLSQAAVQVHNDGQPLAAWRVIRQSRLRPLTISQSGVSVQQVIYDARATALKNHAQNS